MSEKMKKSGHVATLIEVGMIAGTADQLCKQLEETTTLTAEEKAPYTAALLGLATLLADHSLPSYGALTKKGN